MTFQNKKSLENSFAQFYDNLGNHRNIFYIFFTGGLLFLLERAIGLIPDDINVVLLGSDLEEDEINWLYNNIEKPLFVINEYIDDRLMWEILIECNVNNFGWLDVDCFVFNKNIFYEVMNIDQNTCIQGCFYKDQDFIVTTNFMFINIELVKKIISLTKIAPCYYYVNDSSSAVLTNAEKFTKEQCTMLNDEVLGIIKEGRYEHFDTWELFQAAAYSLGYSSKSIRNIHLSLATYYSFVSNELIHLSSSSYFSTSRIRFFIKHSYRDLLAKQLNPGLLITYILMHQAQKTLCSSLYESNIEFVCKHVFQNKSVRIDSVKMMLKKFLTHRRIDQNIVDYILN